MGVLYLSRLTLQTRSREAQRDLADCHNIHRRVLMGFPDERGSGGARERYGVLYRVERRLDGVDVLVQSRAEPDWSRLPEGYLPREAEVKRVDQIYDRLRAGMDLRFRLRANPTRRIAERNTTQDARWRGKRVDVRGEEAQLKWLVGKGERAGFALLAVRSRPDIGDVRMAPGAATYGTRQGTGRMIFGSVVFEGRLRVMDAERFRAALENGIGSGKAYGFGLLSVATLGA